MIKVKPKLKATAIILGVLNFSFAMLQEEKKWEADPDSKKLENPFADDSKATKMGNALYKVYCETCHGKTGIGDGPGSKVLNPKPADHTSEGVQSQTDGEIFWKISEGRGMMVAWKLSLSDEQRWQLVNYIRTLTAE